QIVKESGTRTATYDFEVVTPEEADLMAKLCKFLQETLPIPRIVLPGDPAKHRYSPDDRRRLAAAAARIGRASVAFVESLNRVIAQAEGGVARPGGPGSGSR